MIRQWVCEGELNGVSNNATIADMTTSANNTISSSKAASTASTTSVIKSTNNAKQHAHSGTSANSSDFFIVCNEVSYATIMSHMRNARQCHYC
jgi:hypothetical protein